MARGRAYPDAHEPAEDRRVGDGRSPAPLRSGDARADRRLRRCAAGRLLRQQPGGVRQGEDGMNPDVVIVGAGPAGSATAILLAERGFTVMLLDKAAFPRPKICGEYLSPEASRLLDRLGGLKDVDAAGAPPLSGLRIIAPDGTPLQRPYPPPTPLPPPP